MSYARDITESVAAARARIINTWQQFIGPLPIFRTRGRAVPAPINQLAQELDNLAAIGIIEPRAMPIVRLVESGGGRTIYSVENRDGAAFGSRLAYDRIIAAIDPIRGRRYQIFVRSVRTADYDDSKEGLHLDGEVRLGYTRSALPRYLGGSSASPWWVQHGTYRGGDMIRQTSEWGQDLTAGRLEALTAQYLQGAPGYVIGWFFEINHLVYVNPEAIQRWLSMKNGAKNCVAEAVRRSFGKELSAPKAAAIDEFEERVLECGATEDDIDDLTKALRCRIQILDLAGNPVYEERTDPVTKKPYYANSRKVVTLYRHDGHVSEHQPGMPTAERVVIYEGSRVWTAGERPDETAARHTANALELIRRIRPDQAQIIGGEVIDCSGTIYRPRTIDRALHTAAADLGKRPRWAIDEVTGPAALDYKTDMETLINLPDILHIGGAQSYRFKDWKKQQGWISIWKGSRDVWRLSQVEACVARRLGTGIHIDMRAAYLGCDATRGTGPAREWADRCGFPRGGRMRKARVEAVADIEGFAGLVEFTEGVTLTSTAPFGVLTQLGNHFRKNEENQVLPVPLVLWLYESGYMATPTGLVLHYCDLSDGIDFPADRDSAVRFIGSCSYRSSRRTFYTRDKAEANHYASAYNSHIEPLDEGYLVNWEQEGARHDFSHVRAYVLAYLSIAMGTAEALLGAHVVERDTDAFIIDPACDVAAVLGSQYVSDSNYAQWGMFRLKPAAEGRVYATEIPQILTWPGSNSATAELPVLHPTDQHFLIAEIGPGGCGKTHKWLHREYPLSEAPIILCQNNAAAADLRTADRNPHGYAVKTYHEFFRIGHLDPATWTPKPMGSTGLHTKRIIWDEFPVAGPVLLGLVLPWLRKLGIRVVLAGDPLGQLQDFDDPHSGDKVMTVLNVLRAHIDTSSGTDWRAKDCTILQNAKRLAWCASDSSQLDELRNIATRITWAEVHDIWTPADLVLEPTNRLGGAIAKSLENVRIQKYAETPLRLRFKPADAKRFAKKGGILPMVKRPDGGEVEAAIGCIIDVAAGTKFDPLLWFVDDTSTIHSIQGRTIPAPRRIFICENNIASLWCHNATYVAMSRAQQASQLYLFRI